MKISVIGSAGTIGSCAAFNIAIHQITDELVMIDDFSKDKLEAYVTDLDTAVTGLDVKVRAGSYEAMVDSNIVLMAAGSAQVMLNRTEVLPQNVPIIRDVALKIKKYCPEAIVITATNPVDPLNYCMYLSSGLNRKQFIGYSINDSTRFRMFLAEDLNLRSSQIEAYVMGEHGSSQSLIFSSIKVDGKPLSISPEIKQKVRQQVAEVPRLLGDQRVKSGRTQGWASSIGLAAICRAISKNTLETIPGSVVLDGEYGYRNLSMSVPIRVGKDGVHEILEWRLDREEKKDLKYSADTIRPTAEYVEAFLGMKN